MSKVKVWDALNSSPEFATEYEENGDLPFEYAKRYAKEDVDGNIDGIYLAGNNGPVTNLAEQGQPIAVLMPDGDHLEFDVGIVDYEPIFHAARRMDRADKEDT